MLTQSIKQQGLTMVELMVTIAILAIVLAIGIPNLSSWMQNVQIKSTAESVLNGLQLARSEAVRQNTRTRFQLTSSSGMGSWTVVTYSQTPLDPFPAANQIHAASEREGGANARLGVSTVAPDPNNCCGKGKEIAAGEGMNTNPLPGVVFSAFGQVIRDSSVTTITRIDVTNAADSGARRMVILISPSGATKLCDPSMPASNARGCP